jgi:hypothetical protein
MGSMIRPNLDVVAFIRGQHLDIKNLFHQLLGMHGPARAKGFYVLRSTLAVHEAAEEMIVHPAARRLFGESVVSPRLTEEYWIKKSLAFLEELDVDSDAFETQLRVLEKKVLEHAELEEREELEHLRDAIEPDQLERMRKAAEIVEALAPTHAHPGMETVTANVLGGPFASLVDRARDALK